ncbi:MAG: (-)-trans-carveol dehydrogenase [Burkholderia plantarii]|nr:MAG: (-)-trans-carveol dehydrogenase [Burkholderia plantarii]
MTVLAASPATAPRIALITGAAHAAGPSDTGRALALAFARRGWDLALVIDPLASADAADALAAEVVTLGRRAAVLVADLADAGALAALVPACLDALGRPTCVICHGEPPPADDPRGASHAALLDAFARQVAAPVVLGRALAEATPEAARDDERLRAVLIHLLDDALYHPVPERLSDALAQAALHRATTAQALALAPKVRVAALVRARAPHADALAEAACYLAEARGVTGSTLAVDGGEHLAPPEAGSAGPAGMI